MDIYLSLYPHWDQQSIRTQGMRSPRWKNGIFQSATNTNCFMYNYSCTSAVDRTQLASHGKTALIWFRFLLSLAVVIDQGCLTGVQGRPSICVMQLRLIYPLSLKRGGASPWALPLLKEAWFIAWCLRCLFREMLTGHVWATVLCSDPP